nr:natural killer cell receptor 2B4-like [Misgurnus anguillicaudatus]
MLLIGDAVISVCVSGVFGVDEVKSVSVMEGDSVTLHTDITQIQTDQQIVWMFGPQETRIAEIIKRVNSSFIDDNDERFKGTLKLDSQTGSLTITNITITHTGLYKLTIISNRGTSYKRFNVTVYAHLPVPVIIRDSSQCSSSSSSVSKCVLLCSVLNVRDVSLSWYKGNSLLSSISVSVNIRFSLSLEVEYKDTNTYRCVVNNPLTNQTQHLNINELYQMCSGQTPCCSLTETVSRLVISAVVGVTAVTPGDCKWEELTPQVGGAYAASRRNFRNVQVGGVYAANGTAVNENGRK